jgi:hypothetical protein
MRLRLSRLPEEGRRLLLAGVATGIAGASVIMSGGSQLVSETCLGMAVGGMGASRKEAARMGPAAHLRRLPV